MSAEQGKRVRKKSVQFQAWQEGDKHAPTAVRITASRKKKGQAERNKKCQEKKKHMKDVKKEEEQGKIQGEKKGRGRKKC